MRVFVLSIFICFLQALSAWCVRFTEEIQDKERVLFGRQQQQVPDDSMLREPFGQDRADLNITSSDITVLITASIVTLAPQEHLEQIQNVLDPLMQNPFLRSSRKILLMDGVPTTAHLQKMDERILGKWGPTWSDAAIQNHTSFMQLLRHELAEGVRSKRYEGVDVVEADGLHGSWGILRKGVAMSNTEVIMVLQQDHGLRTPSELRVGEIAQMIRDDPTMKYTILHSSVRNKHLFWCMKPLLPGAQSHLPNDSAMELLTDKYYNGTAEVRFKLPPVPAEPARQGVVATRILGYTDNPHISTKSFYRDEVVPRMERAECFNDGENQDHMVTKMDCMCAEHVMQPMLERDCVDGKAKLLDLGMSLVGSLEQQEGGFFDHMNHGRNRAGDRPSLPGKKHESSMLATEEDTERMCCLGYEPTPADYHGAGQIATVPTVAEAMSLYMRSVRA